VTTEGKKCILENEAKQKLFPLLYDNNSKVKINTKKVYSLKWDDKSVIQALTMIAEVSITREKLKTDALLKARWKVDL